MPHRALIKGWMPEPSLRVLESWARELQPGSTMVEVGSMHGRSSYSLAAAAPQATLWCFDVWHGGVEPEGGHVLEDRLTHGYPLPGMPNTIEHFRMNLDGLANVRPVQAWSPDDCRWWKEPVDFFFLDTEGVNPAEWKNIEFWRAFVKPGGSIAGHRYYADGSAFPDVRANVERLRGELGADPETPEGTLLWRFRIPAA